MLVVYYMNRSFYPTSAVPPVSFLIHPKQIQIMWSQLYEYTLHPPHAGTHFRTRQNYIQSILRNAPGAPPREAHKHTGWAGLFLLLDSSSSLVKTAVTTVRKHILHILEIKKTCNNSADTPRPARALDAPLMIQSAR